MQSSEEQEKAIEGVGIEHLCLDFTWPGYDHIQLKRGGKDELVTAENVDQYLEVSAGAWREIMQIVGHYETRFIAKYEGCRNLWAVVVDSTSRLLC